MCTNCYTTLVPGLPAGRLAALRDVSRGEAYVVVNLDVRHDVRRRHRRTSATSHVANVRRRRRPTSSTSGVVNVRRRIRRRPTYDDVQRHAKTYVRRRTSSYVVVRPRRRRASSFGRRFKMFYTSAAHYYACRTKYYTVVNIIRRVFIRSVLQICEF